MKKVLITGADGFIGSHLVEYLLEKKISVRALAQYNSFNNWGWLEEIENLKNVEVVSGDVRDPFFCRTIVKDMDCVLHLAALIAIPYSYIAPQSYIETNIQGTINICQAAKEEGLKKIVHTSTSEVYGTAQYVPIDEKHPLSAQSPYSASKIGADAMAMSYFNSFNLPLAIVRPFNTFGPRQSARAVIPTIISQIASGKKIIELGDMSPTRDFNFVKDTCQGIWEVASSNDCVGSVTNVGSGEEISVHDLVLLISKLMNIKVEVRSSDERIRPKNSEVHRLLCDASLLKQRTKYKAQYNLESGLKETIQWFLDPLNLKKYKANIYNV